MRHHVSGRKLGRTTSERKALFRSLVTSLVRYGSIQTTEGKARALRPLAERLVTDVKTGGTLGIKRAQAFLQDSEVLRRFLSTTVPGFASRKGGFTRIVKISIRHGDAAPMARVEWVNQKSTESKKSNQSP